MRKFPIDNARGNWYNNRDMSNRGKFIVFEGTDGSGKSTQIKLLAKYLEEKGISCYVTREPTDSPFGALLRSCLNGRVETDEYTIAAMFAADRLDHIYNQVNGMLKKLEEGTTVLCDRYYMSSFAYNGEFVDTEWVISLNEAARRALHPDVTIFIDTPIEEAMRRVNRRSETDRYETLEKQFKIREKYFELFTRFKEENVHIVPSESDRDGTQAHIRRIINEEFGF